MYDMFVKETDANANAIVVDQLVQQQEKILLAQILERVEELHQEQTLKTVEGIDVQNLVQETNTTKTI